MKTELQTEYFALLRNMEKNLVTLEEWNQKKSVRISKLEVVLRDVRKRIVYLEELWEPEWGGGDSDTVKAIDAVLQDSET